MLTSRLEGTASDAAAGAVPDDVQERLEDKQATIAELREERDALDVQLDSLQQEYEELADEVERLRGIEDRVEQAERIEEQLDRARDVLGVDVQEGGADEARVQELQERVDELETENERLREQSGSAAADDDLASLLNHEAVRAAIDTAIERGDAGGDNYDPVLSVLATADGEALPAKDIAAPLSISKRTVQRVVKALHAAGVVQTEGSKPTRYKLDREFLENRIEVAEKQAAIAAGGE